MSQIKQPDTEEGKAAPKDNMKYKKKSAVCMLFLVFTCQLIIVPPIYAGTGNAAPMTWRAKWEVDGNDWIIVFLIPDSVRKNGFVVRSTGRKENLVVSNSTFEREWYGGGWDKVTMTTGFRARAWVGYETIPHSNAKLNAFARSLRIYYWW